LTFVPHCLQFFPRKHVPLRFPFLLIGFPEPTFCADLLSAGLAGGVSVYDGNFSFGAKVSLSHVTYADLFFLTLSAHSH